MKLNAKPRIVICMPIGPKDTVNVFETPDGSRWATKGTTVPACVPIQWVMAHMKLVTPLGISTSFISQWGMLSGEARQIMTSRALKIVQDDGYILYWDDDIIVEPMALYTLYSYMEQHPEIGMVSGVYSTRQEPTEPVIYKEHMKGPYWGLTVGPNAVPEEIFGCGAGFMLARVQAIRDMVAANPGVPIWADSKAVPEASDTAPGGIRFTTSWGHDIRFCRLMQEAGWPVYVDGRVELGHFDAAEQKEYRLPNDSPPKMRGHEKGKDRPGSVCLIMPTHNDLDYAAKCAKSFLENTRNLAPVVIALDDASDGVTSESYAEWAKANGIAHAYRFDEAAGMTRSWNYGLNLAHNNGYEYSVCGNADTLFTVGWEVGIVEALETHDLAGPITNASGWGTPRQNVAAHVKDYEPDDQTIQCIADAVSELPTVTLPGPMYDFHSGGCSVTVPEYLNGFCLVARTKTWFAGAFDRDAVFDPAKINSENEVELETRWAIGLGSRMALVPSSFVFHYRSVSRGDAFLCPGAFRPAVPAAVEQ
jgi:GT2 family glycosyltransferase